jgi:two-component sensor histidine kinase
MNILSLISLMLFLMYMQIGLYVLIKSLKTRLNQIFFLLSICFAIWSLGYSYVYVAADINQAKAWDALASFGYCMFPAFMLQFNIKLCNCSPHKRRFKWLFVAILIWGFTMFLYLAMAGWNYFEIVKGDYGWHFLPDTQNLFFYIYYLYLFTATSSTFALLIHWRKGMRNRSDKHEFNLYAYSLVLFLVIGGTTDLLLPLLRITAIPNMGHIASMPWLLAITYGMFKYQLMGVNVNNLIAFNIISQIKEIILFIDNENKIVRSNVFTEKLLLNASSGLYGMVVSSFFENRTSLAVHLNKALKAGQIGPVVLNLRDTDDNIIEANLYFIAVHDRFNDHLGFVIYGHDNREANNLQKEIIIREHAENNLRAISDVLEIRVKERTQELTESYKELQVKMTERMRVEEQINNDIAEKEVLINEIHNRVKNNMNIIISLIMAYDKGSLSAATSKKFKELSRRVKTLLLVHYNLYLSISYSDVDFPNFIKTLGDELLHFYRKKDKVEIRYEVSDVFLDIDYAIPLGLIVNELITNSLQHAFTDYQLRKYPEKKHIIHIQYEADNNNYEITISDNGKGLPNDFDLTQLTTNGLPLTEILVRDQINGNMEFFSSVDGTMFKIVFLANK